MKKLKSTKPPARSIVVTLKVTAAELARIKWSAGKWTDENLSEWVRYAALNFKPNEEDFEK